MRRRRYVSCTSNLKVSFVFVPSPYPTGCATGLPSTTPSVGRRRGLRAVRAHLVPQRARRAGWTDQAPTGYLDQIRIRPHAALGSPKYTSSV